MFNLKNIVNKITDRGRESNPNSPGRAGQEEDDSSEQRAEGFLCPKCMTAFASPSELQAHYESVHAEDSGPDGASPAGFVSMHREVGDKYRRHEDGSTNIGGFTPDDVSAITDVQELQKCVQELLITKRNLQAERDHLEQRAAQLAQLNVTLKATCDEGHSSQIALTQRLELLEGQLAHRESIDDAAVLRQELVQVQRVMDEMNREREKERDALLVELQQLKSHTDGKLHGDIRSKDIEIEKLNQDLQMYKIKFSELNAVYMDLEEKFKETPELRKELISLSERYTQDVKALESELATVSKEKEALKVSLSSLQKTAENDKKSSIENLENILARLDALTIAKDDSESKLKSSQNELSIISKQRDELSTEVMQYQQEIEELKPLNIESKHKIEELTVSLSRSKTKLSQLESEHSELVAQIQAGEGATTAIQQLTQENNSLQDKLREEAEEHSAQKEELVRTIQEVRKRLSECETSKHELEKELRNERARSNSTRDQMVTMADEMESLKVIIKEKDAAEDELEALNRALKMSLESITKQYNDLDKEFRDKTLLLLDLTKQLTESKEKLAETHRELESFKMINKDLERHMEENLHVTEGLKTQLKNVNESRQAIEDTVSELQRAREKMENDIINIKEEKDSLAEDKASLEEKLKDFENQLQVIGVQRASLETSFFELQMNMSDLETEKKDFEEEKNKEIISLKETVKSKSESLEKQEGVIAILMEEKLILTNEIEELSEARHADLNSAQQKYDKLKTELDSCNEAKKTLEKDLAVEVERRKNLEEKNETLSKNVERTVKDSIEKEKVLQASLDDITGEKLALEVQLETSQAERQTLLERCFASTSEAEGLHRTIADLRRKWDESQAALHELGRENQTLQLDIEKLIGRKWAEDSEVAQCTLCHRDFTMIMRKHHCRNCGQIFCNECSSKTAPIASNKKPVRVCDSCYNELAPK